MLGRDPVLLRNAAEDVRKQSGNTEIVEGLLDLSLKKNIEAFAQTISEPVHILVNNASTTPRQRLETEEGIEMQWAVNVLAYFRMIHVFTPHLAKAAGARVVNVASYWAGDLDLSDLEFKRRSYHNDTVYRQSKQADRMLTRSFAEMLQGKNITRECLPSRRCELKAEQQPGIRRP
jgi:NAD(P)-dependent dehydrogenase (short-subunit alcohol dehydrogenase family)